MVNLRYVIINNKVNFIDKFQTNIESLEQTTQHKCEQCLNNKVGVIQEKKNSIETHQLIHEFRTPWIRIISIPDEFLNYSLELMVVAPFGKKI